MKMLWDWRNMVLREGEAEGGAAPEPTPAPTAEAPVEAPAEAPEPAPQVVPLDTFMARVNSLTRQKAELEAQLAAERARVPETPSAPQAQSAPQVAPSQPSVEQLAAQMADQRLFNEKANGINSAGVAKHNNFSQAVMTLNTSFGTMTREFVEAVLEAADGSAEGAADIIHELGTDLQKASRIMMLPPTAQAVQLTKMFSGRAKPAAPAPAPRVSQAPAPIPAVAGGSGSPAPKDIADPSLSMEEFHRQRSEQRQQRGRRR